MFPVVITSNEVIGNIYKVEAVGVALVGVALVGVALVGVQEHQMVQTLLGHRRA